MDKAHEWTDAQLEKLERKIMQEYLQAAREMHEKEQKALKAYAREREQRLKAMDDTPEARREYKAWLESQAIDQARMSAMVEQLSDSAMRANERAAEMSRNFLPMIFSENANMAAFEVDKAVGVDTRFALMDESTARYLMGLTEQDKIIHEVIDMGPAERYAQSLSKTFPYTNRPRDIRWNRQHFTSAITQGILQGESVPNIVKRADAIYGSNRAAAVRAVRTACTSCENAGRISSYERAADMGIDIWQEWMATLDERTRQSHREADGQRVEVGEKFNVGGEMLEYPGDPAADPSETYNCRCTLRARVKGFESYAQQERWSRLPEGMTYEEWKHGKPKAVWELQDGQGRWINDSGIVSSEWYASSVTESMEKIADAHVPFDFNAYSEGEAIGSRQSIVESLPTEMVENTVYDYELGYVSEAEYAVTTMARYTTDQWEKYAYDGYLEKAIQNSSTQYEGVMFRGMRMPTADVEKLEAGGTITPNGVQSWSRDHTTALDYCDMRRGGRPVVLVDVTEGKHTAVSIESVSQYSGEKEVLSSGQVEYEIIRKYDREFEHFSIKRDEPTISTTVIEVRERKRRHS